MNNVKDMVWKIGIKRGSTGSIMDTRIPKDIEDKLSFDFITLVPHLADDLSCVFGANIIRDKNSSFEVYKIKTNTTKLLDYLLTCNKDLVVKMAHWLREEYPGWTPIDLDVSFKVEPERTKK